jgi:antirestriction protein
MTGEDDAAPFHEPERNDGPRIYVASLSDYNAGVLHGTWLRADAESETIHEQITAMLADSPTTRRYGDIAEEWAIHDYEGFGSLRLSEWEPIERISAIGRGIVEHGDAFSAWVAHHDDPDEVLAEEFESHYLGEFSSATDYGEHLLDELGIDVSDLPDVPEGLRAYVQIDVAGWVRDLQIEGAITTVESKAGVYVFWGV